MSFCFSLAGHASAELLKITEQNFKQGEELRKTHAALSLPEPSCKH
jgi:hypothetical protein